LYKSKKKSSNLFENKSINLKRILHFFYKKIPSQILLILMSKCYLINAILFPIEGLYSTLKLSVLDVGKRLQTNYQGNKFNGGTKLSKTTIFSKSP